MWMHQISPLFADRSAMEVEFPTRIGCGRGQGRYNGCQGGRGQNSPRNHHTRLAFIRKYNSCGMVNHHADFCHFLFKLC